MDGGQQVGSETAEMTEEPTPPAAAPEADPGDPAGDPGDPAAPTEEPPPVSGAAPAPAPATASGHVQEISQQNIKNRLNEVITEIEREVEHELDTDDRDEIGARETTAAHTSAQETVTPPVAESPAVPEPTHQSEPAVEGQGDTDAQWQPEAPDASQSVTSGVMPEQNSDQSSAAALSDAPSGTQQISSAEEHVPSAVGSCAPPAAAEVSSVQAQTEPLTGRFSSPFASTVTSSLPRGWPGGGGVAFALSGHRTPSHEAPEQQQWTPPPVRPHDQWKAREAAASPYATLPRMGNTHAHGWVGHPKNDHPKRVHFADTPQVQTFEEDAAQAAQVTLRSRPEAPRGPRPVSAPAAAQLFTIPNMAARPYGQNSPLLVTPAKRTSPPPMSGGGLDNVDVCVADEPRVNQEMSSQSAEPEPEPPIPVAPPVQKAPVPPSKIFTPAHDEPVQPSKKKTMFVDSAFFSPKVHPTWEQQVEMAKRISSSLSDVSNQQSKGQSMYERRKKRSAKWVHGGSQSEAEDAGEAPHVPKEKPLLQLLMNPHGHVYDMNELKKQGWIIDNKGGLSPEICSDLIKDLNSPNGKGAQIFAKRKKRAEKWVVDEEHREARRTDQSQTDSAQQPAPQPQPQQPRAPQPAPAAPKPPQPAAPAPFQQPPVQLQPVPLQSLYQPTQTPQFPSGGVYAPRTAHSWSAAQQQTETKKFKSTSSKTSSEITQGVSLANLAQSSVKEASQVSFTSSQSTLSEVKTTQQSRLTQAMHHEENKENISSSQVLQAMDTTDLTRQDVELKMAEAVFEETARQMEVAGSERPSLGGSVELTRADPADPADPADLTRDDPMEVDPDTVPQMAMLKPIEKPADWVGGATDLVKPVTKPAPVADPQVTLPALRAISKPADWSGPQETSRLSGDIPRSQEEEDEEEEPRPLVALRPVTLPPAEKPVSSQAEEEPKPLVSLKPVAKPLDRPPVNPPADEEPKPLVALKPVPKPQTDEPSGSSAAEDPASLFGARLTSSRPAGGLRQSQLVQQQQAVTSEVTDEVSGIWGRVSAIRDTFDAGSRSPAGSRPAVQVEKPRAPTMAVPNAFHQIPFTYVDPKTAPAATRLANTSDLQGEVGTVQQQQGQQSDDALVAWGDEDEQAYMEPTEFSSNQSAGFTEDFGQSETMSDIRSQSYQATENVYQSHSTHSTSEFQRSATDGSSGGWSQQQQQQPISAQDTSDVMFQCEVARVETTVNQEALRDYLDRTAAVQEPGPSSAPPVPEVTMRHQLPPPPAATAAIDQADSSQAAAAAAARAAMLAERQQNRQSWTNYNTAPRGWGNQDHFYRPVTFTQPLMSQ